MKKIAVTGGSGRLGTWVIKELLEHRYDVVNLDSRSPAVNQCGTIMVNMLEYKEVYNGLAGVEAVVHLAAIPSPGGHPNEVVFANNVMSTYHVLEACAGLGIAKTVIASSEAAYGFSFPEHPFDPLYAPIDENHPLLAQDCYGLSKIAGEETARMFHRRTGMQAVSLRFATIITPDMYGSFIRQMHASSNGKRALWSYVDVRDAASACRLALETEGLESQALNITADSTFMDVPSAELIAAHFPGVKMDPKALRGFAGIVSNEKAKRTLGWQCRHSWREQVE